MSDELQEQKDRELTNRYGSTIGQLVETADSVINSALYAIHGESPKELCREALKLLNLVARSANAKHPVGDVDSVREAVSLLEGEIRGFLRRPVAAKDGLLWSDGLPLACHTADRLADLHGLGCGEQLVRQIEARQREREAGVQAQAELVAAKAELTQLRAEQEWLRTSSAILMGGKVFAGTGTFHSVADAMRRTAK